MSKKSGFTLAEVLITLGIIGVVSAMTIPTLIQNYNERVWKTSAEVFTRKLEEALKTMNTQQTLAGHTTTESFVEELSKHFKTNKVCQNDELLNCFSDIVYWGTGDATPEEIDMSKIKTARNFGQDDWNTNIIGVQFANGVSALIAYNPTTGENSCSQDPFSNRITGSDCLAILFDTSANKNPNTSGKDLRANGNVLTLGKGCAIEIGDTCYRTPVEVTPYYWQGCNRDGTSTTSASDRAFMQEHGLNYCLGTLGGYFGDTWAGAVEACGGKANLPTMSQLTELANKVHGTDEIGTLTNGSSWSCPSGSSNCLDTDLLSSLGFNKYSKDFYIWSQDEGKGLYFNGNYVQAGSTRAYDKAYALCIMN